MDRMLFIVKKVAVRTTDTMAAVILAIVLNDVCNDVEVVPGQRSQNTCRLIEPDKCTVGSTYWHWRCHITDHK